MRLDPSQREAITTKKKHKKKGKALDLQQRQEYHGGAVFWSPRNMREARAREVIRVRDEAEEKLQKAKTKELMKAARILKKREVEERRVERERAKKDKEKEKEKKAKERAQKKQLKEQEKQAATSSKSAQVSQKGKRPASKQLVPKNKRQKRVGGGASGEKAVDLPSAPSPKTTNRGRNVNLPSKFR